MWCLIDHLHPFIFDHIDSCPRLKAYSIEMKLKSVEITQFCS